MFVLIVHQVIPDCSVSPVLVDILAILQEPQPHALTASAMETLIMIILKFVIRHLAFVFSASIIHNIRYLSFIRLQTKSKIEQLSYFPLINF